MENSYIEADAILRRAAWRLVPLILAMYIAAFLNRVNVSFAALTMNKDLGFSPEVFGWGTGIYLASCGIGLMVGDAKVEAIRLGSVNSGASSDNAGKIHWMGIDIMPNSINGGLSFHPCWSSYSEVNFYSPGVIKEPKGKVEFKELSMAWDGYTDIKRMTEPPAPDANTARLYVEDDGSGRMRLMVKFPTGAAQQVAVEAP